MEFRKKGQLEAAIKKSEQVLQAAGILIEGTVVDKGGKPVEGALVLPMPHGGRPVKTDRDGKFQLAGADESTERIIRYLIVRHLERNLAAAQSTEEYTKPLEITLQKGITLYGQIRGAYGKPIANAKVYPNVKGHGYNAGFGYTKFPRADEKGFYKIKAMPAGLSYKLDVSAPGFESNPVELGKLDGTDDRKTDIILLRKAGTHLPVNLPGGMGGVDPTNPLSFRPGQDPTEGKTAVSIEARFLLVPDNFLEDIGMELFGSKDSADDSDGKTNSEFLDDLQVEFIIKATQQHKESKTLTAPRLSVFDNEPANISVLKERPYVESYTEVESAPNKPEAKLVYFEKGVKMDITPHVTEDKKNIRVELEAELSDMFLGPEYLYKGKHPYHKPEISRTIFTLAAIVPDGKTMLIGPKPYTDYKEDGTKVEQNIIMLLKATIIKGTTVLANPVPLVEVVRGAI